MMIKIYTDGSSIGNPGQGGWAFLVLSKTGSSIQYKCAGGEAYTTNNRMELTAVIQALVYCGEKDLYGENVILYMDSMYVHSGITQYLSQWIRRGRKLANKKPVQNKDLWIILHDLLPKFPYLQLQRVKAHASNKYNNIVDDLARNTALRMPISSDKKLLYAQVEDKDNSHQQSLF